MTKEVRLCTEMAIEPEQLEHARRLAIEENPDNALPVPSGAEVLGFEKTQPAPSPPLLHIQGSRDQARLALLYGKKWSPGRTLNVRFLNGSSFVQEKVKQFAATWQVFANIRFNFNSTTNAEIRVSFNPGGSYSYLGTDALAPAK